MDAMERLAEKNRRHLELVSNEKRANLKLLPFLFLYLVIYFWGASYLIEIDHQEGRRVFTGMTIYVWLLSNLICYGLGSIILANALMYSLSVEWLAKALDKQVRHFHVVSVCLRRLLYSAAWIYAGIWLGNVIRENDRSIASALRFGFESTPFIFEAIAGFLLLMVFMVLFMMLFAVLYLPGQIKAQLLEDVTQDK